MKNQQWTSHYYLAANEQMQLDLTCVNIAQDSQQYRFLVRTTCVEVLDKIHGSKIPFQMVFTIEPDAHSIAVQLDIVDWTTVNPGKIKAIVETIQTSPQLAHALLQCMEERIANASSEEVLQLMALKKFYQTTLVNGITNFTVSKQAQDLVFIVDPKAMSQQATFSMHEQGGKIHFQTTVGFVQNNLVQLYDVSSIMYVFIDRSEKLGYYFEFYLDESNHHHQEIYRALPDHLMDHDRFLHTVAHIMEVYEANHQKPELKPLIQLFKASI